MSEHPDKRYLELAEKWLLGTISPSEMAEYARWYNEIDPGAVLEVPARSATDADEYRLKLLRKINEQRRLPGIYRIGRWGWAAAAAAVLLAVGAGIYLVRRPSAGPPGYATIIRSQPDIPAGGKRAVLILAGGKKVLLDSAANGTVAQQGNSQVRKLSNGHLSYFINREGTAASPSFNTLATPRGGQYSLTLPDGTRIWLNAASSVTYPTAFTGKDRKVIVTGEAYFEVAGDKERPFRVFIGSPTGLEVGVLGTHFNINAYPDEGTIRTTLLEGRVRVFKGDHSGSTLLSPGQQAQAGPGASLKVAEDVNTEEVMAWKNGLFQFDNADIQTVMRQLARWYDVDVSYEGHITEDRFAGKLPRDASAAETLHILERNQVHFRIEEKRIIVMP